MLRPKAFFNQVVLVEPFEGGVRIVVRPNDHLLEWIEIELGRESAESLIGQVRSSLEP